MQIKTATRKQVKLRLGLSSVSGGGKTVSALLLAYGLVKDWKKIGVIDTENESASLYADHKLNTGFVIGDFQTLVLTPPFSPERYIQAIDIMEKAGIEVIIIDSISHEWEGEGGILSLADAAGGGFNSAWKTLTPRHDKFKSKILNSKAHIITTVRRKQDYVLVEDVNKQGRTVQKPMKAGLKEVTREGWEYELTINLEIDSNHLASASKDRSGLFAAKEPFLISVETGEVIKNWCESGAAVMEVQKVVQAAEQISNVIDGEIIGGNIEPLKETYRGLLKELTPNLNEKTLATLTPKAEWQEDKYIKGIAYLNDLKKKSA